MLTGLRIIETYKCNRHCKFCYQRKQDGVILTPKNLEKALDNSEYYLPCYITILGGEVSYVPKETEAILKVIQDRFSQVGHKGITTNGDGDYEWYKSLHLYGINHYNFSMPVLQDKVLSTVEKLSKLSYFTTRLNVFFDINNAKEVLKFAMKNEIEMTLCADILKAQPAEEIKEMIYKVCQPTNLKEFSHNFIVYIGNYSFWVYKHDDNYQNDNLIILPNGETTLDFNDVVNCKGAYAKN